MFPTFLCDIIIHIISELSATIIPTVEIEAQKCLLTGIHIPKKIKGNKYRYAIRSFMIKGLQSIDMQ